MTDYQDSLTTLLRENLSEDAFSEVQRVLERFYLIALTGVRYPFAPLKEATVRQDEIIKALQGIFGESEVTGIVFFSQPFDKSPCVTEKVYWDSLLGNSLADSLEASLLDSLKISLRGSLWKDFYFSLFESLDTGLSLSLWDNSSPSTAGRRNSLWASLFYYLGFAIVGDQKRTSTLQSLVEILPDFIPLGRKKDEPTTWIVVCAVDF